MTSTNVSCSGIGVLTAVFLTFIMLKLLEVIEWSWVWVLSPAWAPSIILVFLLGLSVLLGPNVD